MDILQQISGTIKHGPWKDAKVSIILSRKDEKYYIHVDVVDRHVNEHIFDDLEKAKMFLTLCSRIIIPE